METFKEQANSQMKSLSTLLNSILTIQDELILRKKLEAYADSLAGCTINELVLSKNANTKTIVDFLDIYRILGYDV